MIHSTVDEKIVRPERSRLDLFLEQMFKATPLYMFAQGLKSALRSRRD